MKLPARLLTFLRLWGLDRAVAYTVVGRGWAVLAGPVSLFFIARFLRPDEQGFYYTFGSILGLQIFFELGLSSVLVHFASHEKAALEWTREGTLTGDLTSKAKLASLLRKASVWYGCMALLVVAIVGPAGFIFFQRYQPMGGGVEWQLPWVWIVLVSAASLFVSPVFALLEGCGLVAEIAFMRACQGIAGSLLLWLALIAGWGLFAAPLLNTIGLLWAIIWLARRKKGFLRDLLPFRFGSITVNWRREVWQFQWKIALSWLSSYFIFQLFNPVLFAFHSAAEAGRMGMSINVMTSISMIAAAWVSTKAGPFGALIARREYDKLDRLFFPALWQSILVVAIGGVSFWLAVAFLNSINHPLSLRLLAPLPLALLVATSILNLVVYVEAVYLRSHKQEPFLAISILIGCLVGLSTYWLGKPFGATGMMVGFFVINLVLGLGVGTWVFARKRRLWHKEVSEPEGIEIIA